MTQIFRPFGEFGARLGEGKEKIYLGHSSKIAQTERQTDGQVDGWMDRQTNHCRASARPQ